VPWTFTRAPTYVQTPVDEARLPMPKGISASPVGEARLPIPKGMAYKD
jgi:hypothetical protein